MTLQLANYTTRSTCLLYVVTWKCRDHLFFCTGYSVLKMLSLAYCKLNFSSIRDTTRTVEENYRDKSLEDEKKLFPQDGATVIAFFCLSSFCGIMMNLLDKNT